MVPHTYSVEGGCTFHEDCWPFHLVQCHVQDCSLTLGIHKYGVAHKESALQASINHTQRYTIIVIVYLLKVIVPPQVPPFFFLLPHCWEIHGHLKGIMRFSLTYSFFQIACTISLVKVFFHPCTLVCVTVAEWASLLKHQNRECGTGHSWSLWRGFGVLLLVHWVRHSSFATPICTAWCCLPWQDV